MAPAFPQLLLKYDCGHIRDSSLPIPKYMSVCADCHRDAACSCLAKLERGMNDFAEGVEAPYMLRLKKLLTHTGCPRKWRAYLSSQCGFDFRPVGPFRAFGKQGVTNGDVVGAAKGCIKAARNYWEKVYGGDELPWELHDYI